MLTWKLLLRRLVGDSGTYIFSKDEIIKRSFVEASTTKTVSFDYIWMIMI